MLARSVATYSKNSKGHQLWGMAAGATLLSAGAYAGFNSEQTLNEKATLIDRLGRLLNLLLLVIPCDIVYVCRFHQRPYCKA